MIRATTVSVCLIALLSFWSSPSMATPQWYYGNVERIYMFNGGFVVKMTTTALSDCQWEYVYFRELTLPEKTVDRAYSMALSAQASGKQLGVVIDKTINGPGGMCECNGNVDIQ